MIARKRPINEKVNYMRTIRPFTAGERVTMSGDNIFESLATTNPELFDRAKLEAILESKDIVDEFNKYISIIINQDFDRFEAFIKEATKKNSKISDDEFSRRFMTDFNVLNVNTFNTDIEYLKSIFADEKEFMRVLFTTYLPDGLTEEGVKTLIRVRLANDQMLTNCLMMMMENNYELFNINSVEAQGIKNKLASDKTNPKTIGDIRQMFKDPKVLDNFKDEMGNYDFRPIGGCYLIMRDKLEWQGAAPTKYLQNIFKYDCIIYSHGGMSPFNRSGLLGTILNPKIGIAANVWRLLDFLQKNENFNKYATEDLKKLLDYTMAEVSDINRSLFINMKDLDYMYELLLKLRDATIDLAKSTDNQEAADWMYAYCSCIDDFMQPISDKHNIARNMKDGRSADWTIQPVNSTTQKNFTHIIDLLRALKNEGFKNVLVMSCNPGSVKMPRDVVNDKNFTVTIGNHSVMIESAIADKEATDYLTEGLMDSIKYTMRSIKNAMNNFFSKCRAKFNEFAKGITTHIDSRFKNKQFNKTKMSIMTFDGKKAAYTEVDVKSVDEFRRLSIQSNESFIRGVQTISDNQKNYLNLISKKYNLGEENLYETTILDDSAFTNTTIVSESVTNDFVLCQKPTKEFFAEARVVFKNFLEAMGEIQRKDSKNQNRSDPTKKIKDDPKFKKIVEQAMKDIDFAESRRPKSLFYVAADASNLPWDIHPNTLYTDIFSGIFDMKYVIMRPHKNPRKDFTQTKYFHKALPDRSIIIIEFFISARYDGYGYFYGWNQLYTQFSQIENNEKNLRALNILESTELPDNIFGNIDLM